ncbi:MAG TPA: hypothetical protein VIY72_07210 [Acidimicrobiales bacterium]
MLAFAVVLLIVGCGVGGAVYAQRHRADTRRQLSLLIGQVVRVSAGSEGKGFSVEVLDGTLVDISEHHLLLRPKFDPVPARFDRMKREGACLVVPLIDVLDVTSGRTFIRFR